MLGDKQKLNKKTFIFNPEENYYSYYGDNLILIYKYFLTSFNYYCKLRNII